MLAGFDFRPSGGFHSETQYNGRKKYPRGDTVFYRFITKVAFLHFNGGIKTDTIQMPEQHGIFDLKCD